MRRAVAAPALAAARGQERNQVGDDDDRQRRAGDQQQWDRGGAVHTERGGDRLPAHRAHHHPEGDPDEHRHQRPGCRLPRHHPADLPAASTEHLHDRQVAVPPADRGDERVHQRQGGQREHRRRQRDRDVRQLVPQLHGAGDERCPHHGVRVGLIERIGGGIEVGARLELDEQVLRRHLDGRALQRTGREVGDPPWVRVGQPGPRHAEAHHRHGLRCPEHVDRQRDVVTDLQAELSCGRLAEQHLTRSDGNPATGHRWLHGPDGREVRDDGHGLIGDRSIGGQLPDRTGDVPLRLEEPHRLVDGRVRREVPERHVPVLAEPLGLVHERAVAREDHAGGDDAGDGHRAGGDGQLTGARGSGPVEGHPHPKGRDHSHPGGREAIGHRDPPRRRGDAPATDAPRADRRQHQHHDHHGEGSEREDPAVHRDPRVPLHSCARAAREEARQADGRARRRGAHHPPRC